MSDILRPAVPEDAEACGRICYDAFSAIDDAHNFPREFPSAEVTIGLLRLLIEHPGFYGVVAERGGKIVGSNFMDERSRVFGIGPISVDPSAQNQGIGRKLMLDVVNRGRALQAPSVRLLQSTYHNRSLCLYTSIGFRTREPMSVMQGPALNIQFPGYNVRSAKAEDVDACDTICHDVHGFTRRRELEDAIHLKTALVVEYMGQITGYATDVAFFAHAVCRTNQDLKALIGAAPAFGGPGFLLPTRNYEVFAWCLANGLRLVQPMTLMTIGLYNEPAGAWMPSVLY
jgi:GNAT superfamily N-acetyltransferase